MRKLIRPYPGAKRHKGGGRSGAEVLCEALTFHAPPMCKSQTLSPRERAEALVRLAAQSAGRGYRAPRQ